jgi:hypothetical protein
MRLPRMTTRRWMMAMSLSALIVAMVGLGLHWLVGISMIALAKPTTRLAIWVGRDICDGLCAEAGSIVRSAHPARWSKGLSRGSGLWDEWLDGGLPALQRGGFRRPESETSEP